MYIISNSVSGLSLFRIIPVNQLTCFSLAVKETDTISQIVFYKKTKPASWATESDPSGTDLWPLTSIAWGSSSIVVCFLKYLISRRRIPGFSKKISFLQPSMFTVGLHWSDYSDCFASNSACHQCFTGQMQNTAAIASKSESRTLSYLQILSQSLRGERNLI